MRKTVLTIASLVLAIGVSACSVTKDPNPPTVTYGPVINDGVYAERIRLDAPELSNTDTRAIVQNSVEVCRALDRGATVNNVRRTITAGSLSRETANVLINGAVSYKCPQHRDLLK